MKKIIALFLCVLIQGCATQIKSVSGGAYKINVALKNPNNSKEYNLIEGNTKTSFSAKPNPDGVLVYDDLVKNIFDKLNDKDQPYFYITQDKEIIKFNGSSAEKYRFTNPILSELYTQYQLGTSLERKINETEQKNIEIKKYFDKESSELKKNKSFSDWKCLNIDESGNLTENPSLTETVAGKVGESVGGAVAGTVGESVGATVGKALFGSLGETAGRFVGGKVAEHFGEKAGGDFATTFVNSNTPKGMCEKSIKHLKSLNELFESNKDLIRDDREKANQCLSYAKSLQAKSFSISSDSAF